MPAALGNTPTALKPTDEGAREEVRPMVSHWVYLTGLGTGYRTRKGIALARYLATRGFPLDIVDLRVPSFRSMRLKAMVDRARERLGPDPGSTVIIGASFGGYVAATLAASDPRVARAILYAPALHLRNLAQWYPWGIRAWRALGWLPIPDKTEGRLRRLDVGLLDELEGLGSGPPCPSVPTLIVHGRRDRLVPVEVSRRWAAASGRVRLVEVDDGHALSSTLDEVISHTDAFVCAWLGATAS